MTVWYAIPSKRHPAEAEEVLFRWEEKGYRTAVFRDAGDAALDVDHCMMGRYRGYADAVNQLCEAIIRNDPQAQWIVTGGDDVLPDPNRTAEEIGRQCSEHFGGTFGVMQPTGDGHGIENICGSPWMGREWCQRINGGKGPLWHEYTHNFVDEELQNVALKLGAFWQRPDLIHKHNNWMWTTGVKPKFLEAAYSQEHWNKYQTLFQKRRSHRFPGHEPLPIYAEART
jgi:hypothetical protein